MIPRDLQPKYPNLGDSGSLQRQQSRSSSSLSSFGNSMGRRVSLLFLLVNLFALLQYRHLMSRTLIASTNHHEEEFMMGSYHGKLKIGSKIKTSQIESTNHLRAIDTNRTSSIRKQRYQSDNLVHSPSVSTPTIDTTNNKGKFAYVFLLGGAMSTKAGTDYRGGLYGAVTAAHSLRRQGSKADVIIMVQISATTNATKLPDLEEALL